MVRLDAGGSVNLFNKYQFLINKKTSMMYVSKPKQY